MLFGKKTDSSESLHECKRCGRTFDAEHFAEKVGLCHGCLAIAESDINTYTYAVQTLQDQANASTDVKEKISLLTLVLQYLFEYKVKYEDNDIKLFDSDARDLIDQIVDVISQVRLETPATGKD